MRQQSNQTSSNKIERNSNLLNRKEAADFLRVNPGTLANWEWNKTQKIPVVNIGRKVFYRLSDLENWINSHVHNIE